jgi:anti-sigma B factor antagonist
MYSFQYEKEEKPNGSVLKMKGRLMDLTAHEEIKHYVDFMLASGKNALLVDLTNLEYMNSMGLNLLIQLQTKIRVAGGKMFLACPNKKVRELIELTKLNSLFNIFETFPEALVEMEK